MSDYVPVSDCFMQELANGMDGWDTSLPDFNDDMIDWSKFIDFDAPAGAQPTISADYDTQGGLDPDFGATISRTTQTYAPGILGWDPATQYGPHTGMGLSPATGTRGSALYEPTNDASYYGYDTNLLATESETVPSQDAGMHESENALEDPGVPKSSSKDETWLGITDDNAAPSSDKTCMCIVCLNLAHKKKSTMTTNASGQHTYCCRFPACPNLTMALYSFTVCKHERTHFRHGGKFICAEARCSYSVTRWSDLKRHYTSKHCLSPKTKFPCPELSCKYSGENGFLRKDKMKSHYQTVHEGKAKPGKRFQAIQPKTGSAA